VDHGFILQGESSGVARGAVDLPATALGESVAMVRHLQHTCDAIDLRTLGADTEGSYHRRSYSFRVRAQYLIMSNIYGELEPHVTIGPGCSRA
jgi:hypothetical protein